jgi:hypothetical protein
MEDIFSPDPFRFEAYERIFEYDESVPVTKEIAEAWRNKSCDSTCKECPMYGKYWFRIDDPGFLLKEYKNCAFSFADDGAMIEAFLKHYHQ